MSVGLAIIGYGKMGRLIAQLAPEYGFEVRATFTSANISSLSVAALNGASIAVEFSEPAAAPENIRRLAALGVDCVSGTTGWFAQLPAVREFLQHANSSLVYGANFSIGVNVFFQIVAEAAARFSRHVDYQAWGWEIHHRAKKDAPSGTLLRLREEMLAAGFSGPMELSSSRAGAHPGTHEIGFDSPGDTITLRHTARSREGFARGALQAARWLTRNKRTQDKGTQDKGIFEFREILDELCGVDSAEVVEKSLS
ncbi:MAG TPA: dihydrodipicolinate reductase C-terminal domain-containing protein [Candidatus Dormibacteraeota bacterium]|nr:dihydrodipicolinate reductase C-terminal domain-containing protein [Candidatus Dormibacteraeota bacterium]